MGVDIIILFYQCGEFGNIVVGLEVIGLGVNWLGDIQSGYLIFNWDDLLVKEGLYNCYMVGFIVWYIFFQIIYFILYEKKVLVIGYGLVGQGVVVVVKVFGGQVMVVEIDFVCCLQVVYDGWYVVDFQEVIVLVDVVVMVIGGKNVVNCQVLDWMKVGVFIFNVGYVVEEIDGDYLCQYFQEEVMLYINVYCMVDKIVYLLVNGLMFNLIVGFGDSLNVFDVIFVVMVSGICYIVIEGMCVLVKVYFLFQVVWQQVL